MKQLILFLISCMFFSTVGCTQSKESSERKVGTYCEDCEMMFDGMPENLSWKATIASADEPGEKMIIRGKIYKADGKTPASNVILYVYHTDNTGRYSPAKNQNQARRHGHLRGWMKTDDQGNYEFTTIRPASYPNRKDPQHIHPIIKEPNTTLYWIDEFLFDDDPLLTTEVRNQQQKRGGSGIIKLEKNENGVWVGTRDIVLGKNIPNY